MAQFQRQSTQKKVLKPFCKVCFDAGKSETEYTSHFVKSEPGIKGKVVCPTLLNQACTYCHQNGHTVKFCKVLAQNNKKYEKEEKKQKYYQAQDAESNLKQNPNSTKVQNTFAALDIDSEEPESNKQDVVQFPALCEPSTPPYPPPGEDGSTTPPYPPPDYVQKPLSYASMAAKPPKLLSLSLPEQKGSRESSVLSGTNTPRGDESSKNDEYLVEDNYSNHKSLRRSRESLIRLLKWGEEETDDEEYEDEEDNYPKYKTEWSSSLSQAKRWSEWESSDDEE
jgi:hypothetical protein